MQSEGGEHRGGLQEEEQKVQVSSFQTFYTPTIFLTTPRDVEWDFESARERVLHGPDSCVTLLS